VNILNQFYFNVAGHPKLDQTYVAALYAARLPLLCANIVFSLTV
jgi:hypothetical protein